MSEFEMLLQENIVPLKRYVNFKINNKHDAEDIIQDVCLVATLKFKTLKNKSAFKAWLVGIANNKCNDYYRQKAKNMNVSLESIAESKLIVGKFGVTEQIVVRDTLNTLEDKEKQILRLYFLKIYHKKIYQKNFLYRLALLKAGCIMQKKNSNNIIHIKKQ